MRSRVSRSLRHLVSSPFLDRCLEEEQRKKFSVEYEVSFAPLSSNMAIDRGQEIGSVTVRMNAAQASNRSIFFDRCPLIADTSLRVDEFREVTLTDVDSEILFGVECPHKSCYGNLCTQCQGSMNRLLDYRSQLDTSSRLHMTRGSTYSFDLLSTEEAAETYARNRLLSAFRNEKLLLVLDLDSTLIHAASISELIISASSETEYLQAQQQILRRVSSEISDAYILETPFNFLLKLRPGLLHFFERASEHFHLLLYTFGERNYANAVMKILDPSGILFGGRILCRDDENPDFSRKDIHRLFPGLDPSLFLVVDDNDSVWEGFRGLVCIPPYLFWNTSREINNSAAHSWMSYRTGAVESSMDEPPAWLPDEDDFIFGSLLELLARVHQTCLSRFSFSSLTDANTIPKEARPGHVLRSLREEVLKGIVILFTGIIPLDRPVMKSPEARVATYLGARVITEFSSFQGVTHVVAASAHSNKARQALETPGLFVVALSWLIEAARTWRRPDELFHSLIHSSADESKNMMFRKTPSSESLRLLAMKHRSLIEAQKRVLNKISSPEMESVEDSASFRSFEWGDDWSQSEEFVCSLSSSNASSPSLSSSSSSRDMSDLDDF